jgi:mono/diheme cytochrome c family protein
MKSVPDIVAVQLAVLSWLCCPLLARADAEDGEADQHRPGLIAEYRSLADRTATLARIDAKPAFYLGRSGPHPRLPAGPFEVVWTGLLLVKDAGPLVFDAWVGGDVTVEIDGVVVLKGKGETDTTRLPGSAKLDRPQGLYPLRVRYRSLPDVPARLQIGWEGPTFAREPLPAWRLKHRAEEVPEAVRQEERTAGGRESAARLGCARCHSSAFPGLTDPPPGPALTDLGARVERTWLLRWLEDPAAVHPDARMPTLFPAGRGGFTERWLVAESLLGPAPAPDSPKTPGPGDHRAGRQVFINQGCAACHQLPDLPAREQASLGRFPLRGLGDRLTPTALSTFLANPHGRYPDGRMPRLPLTPEAARNIAAYLLLWAGPTRDAKAVEPPSAEEINAVQRRLKVRNPAAAGAALVREKRCAACHPGLDATLPADLPLRAEAEDRGCLSAQGLPRFSLDAATKQALLAYQKVAGLEKHPSPFASMQRLLQNAGCVRCHQRDSDRPPPIEAVGSTLGGAFLQEVPYQRTPRLNDPLQKYTRAHLVRTVREGVSGLRPDHYTYRMPAFGTAAETLVQALAEGDGELPAGEDAPERASKDPTLGPLVGPQLAGFQGYGCVSCHLWQGQQLSQPDPVASGPELTRLTGRIRKDWFDRFLEDPARSHPGTPMPAVFTRGKPALLPALDGDPARQKEALWSYLALGKNAPSPKPPPPLAVLPPGADEPPLAALIPIRLPDGSLVESLTLLSSANDLLVYDVGSCTPHSFFSGGRILREVQGRLRRFRIEGAAAVPGLAVSTPFRLLSQDKADPVQSVAFQGHDLIADGVRIHARVQFPSAAIELTETVHLVSQGPKRALIRVVRLRQIPAGQRVEIQGRIPESMPVEVKAVIGRARDAAMDKTLRVTLSPNKEGIAEVQLRYALPPAGALPALERPVLEFVAPGEGALERPGYRAIAYPRLRTPRGEDLLMPGGLAVNPRDGRVFMASMKMGEVFVLRDPTGDGKSARYDNYGRGLFQEAYSLLAEDDALYVLHRRNLTRIVDRTDAPPDRPGLADRLERVAALPHGIADTYDYGYGLVRDRTGGFVYTFAPYANTQLPGSGGALRLIPGQPPREIGFGFRNPFGWCVGPDKEIFFTDNQGDWVATNKLCHLGEGQYHGYPNSAQKQHTNKPMAKPTVWVPYEWARSINGVTYDASGGKFGPFSGQFFMAELMFGGAIVRAQVEKVNGVYQGACFPFWGKGLLGPLCLSFDPKGRLWVGAITEPGWMAQPDRGALYRIDFTGTTPFEIESIHVRPRGFRLVFTTPVSAEQARKAASYAIEHYRYEYTGAYGSPELDRTKLSIDRVEVAEDGRSVELTTGPLVKDRVYLISAPGVRSAKSEGLVHPMGAYTLHVIPRNETR